MWFCSVASHFCSCSKIVWRRIVGLVITAHTWKHVDDSDWLEVNFINRYALFMGYLSMAVKGLGFLVLTWTTVVLLGGFVSMLQKKDFWCLTFITLLETAGVFDVCLNEKLSYIGKSAWGLTVANFSLGWKISKSQKWWLCYILLIIALTVVQLVVFAIIVCPLAAVYLFGLLISMGISLWRLIHHDYGSNADGDANLRPALDVLYALAFFQGVLFCYRFILSRLGKRVATSVAMEYVAGLDDNDKALKKQIMEYLRDIKMGCEKDPSFARGRNLITYAVDLMGSKTPDDYLSGVRILDTLIRIYDNLTVPQDKLPPSIESFKEPLFPFDPYVQEHILMKHLIVSASSGHILEKLLQTLDWTSPYDRETRDRAATIILRLAGSVCLEQFPRAIQGVSSLISTFEEYRLLHPFQRDWLFETYDQDWLKTRRTYHSLILGKDYKMQVVDYKMQVLKGLRILGKLAADENNCRVMSNTHGLLPKIMAPVTSDLLHNTHHDAWSDVVEGSLQVMRQLASAPGETGAKLRREISRSSEATRTMERILTCTTCGTDLQQRAMEIITRLDIIDTQSTQGFIKKLLDIFTGGNIKDDTTRPAAGEAQLSPEAQKKKDDDTTRLAGEALAKLSFQGGSNIATIILRVHDDDVVTSLSEMLLDAKVPITPRISAAEILQHLCVHYTNNDDCLQKLKEAMTDVMPKVLREILTGEATQTGTGAGADRHGFSSPHADIEGQHGDDYDARVRKENYELYKYHKLNPALLSLCVTVCDTFISGDQDLALQFDASSFPRKLEEMVKRYSNPTTVDCLRMMKLTTKMVISIMKHSGCYLKEDLKSLMKSLSIASKETDMVLLDGSMVFASGGDGATTTKPVRTLASLVKEAQELVSLYGPQELEVTAPSTRGEP